MQECISAFCHFAGEPILCLNFLCFLTSYFGSKIVNCGFWDLVYSLNSVFLYVFWISIENSVSPKMSLTTLLLWANDIFLAHFQFWFYFQSFICDKISSRLRQKRCKEAKKTKPSLPTSEQMPQTCENGADKQSKLPSKRFKIGV